MRTKSKSKNMIPDAHFYDTKEGYIHYVSKLMPGLECRVYDAIHSIEDINVSINDAIQFVYDSENTQERVRNCAYFLSIEAIHVSNDGEGFMDRLHKNSPFRDNISWMNDPDGRARFVKERQDRRELWLMMK